MSKVYNVLKVKTKSEIEEIKKEINLSEDEEIVFDMTIKSKSVQEIADTIYKSQRTVFYIKSRIRQKIENYYDYQEYCKKFDKYRIDPRM